MPDNCKLLKIGERKYLDKCIASDILAPMPTKQMNVRANGDDQKIMAALRSKLGIDNTQIFRQALRALMEQQKLVLQKGKVVRIAS